MLSAGCWRGVRKRKKKKKSIYIQSQVQWYFRNLERERERESKNLDLFTGSVCHRRGQLVECSLMQGWEALTSSWGWKGREIIWGEMWWGRGKNFIGGGKIGGKGGEGGKGADASRGKVSSVYWRLYQHHWFLGNNHRSPLWTSLKAIGLAQGNHCWWWLFLECPYLQQKEVSFELKLIGMEAPDNYR